ncbi:MAG: enoyl-CoA hydratase/isomerase family protein [Balneolales bacterium]|nr:enoyl-CoA hydratase/isomerase family protein [Balneolales bacterium]
MSALTLTRPNTSTLIACINRVEANNAINFEVMAGLEEACQIIESDDNIQVFVLTGQGHKYFAAGGDLKEFAALETEQQARQMSMRMGNILHRIESAECWTIAVINGDAYGGACEMMLAFDFRIAVKHARFRFTQARFYLTPGWGGLTRLVERCSRSTVLFWLGTQAVIDSDAALSAGLVDLTFGSANLDEHLAEITRKLCENDRRFTHALKEGITYAQKHPHRESITNERSEFSKLWGSREHHKRVKEFLARKKKTP